MSTTSGIPKKPALRECAKACCPRAGLGHAFSASHQAQPKEMLAVVDKPQIQYVAEECVASARAHHYRHRQSKNSIETISIMRPMLERFLEEKGRPTRPPWCDA